MAINHYRVERHDWYLDDLFLRKRMRNLFHQQHEQCTGHHARGLRSPQEP